MELATIKGIGPKTKDTLSKIGIYDINDLVRYYPYRYNIYKTGNLQDYKEDETCIINGSIISNPKVSYIKRNLNRVSFSFETNNVIINVTIFNRAFMSRYLNVGKKITLIGKYNKLKNSFVASDIKLKQILKIEVEPVYHMINGLKKKTLVTIIDNALKESNIAEIVPDYINRKYNFIDTVDAIKEIHFPTNTELTKKAKLKLKYEELFEFMFKINLIKFKNQIFDNFVVKEIKDEEVNELIESLPFKLTSDQLKAIDDIKDDFNDFRRMNRLILGDVGSGKTIVSFMAILMNHKAGYQSALLSPTEVLSSQHYENFLNLTKNMNIKVGYLVGSLTKSEKDKIKQQLMNNEIDVLIGTHAILEDDVEFNNIGLVITDEQHRFGVNQRKSLQNKGVFVDVLYMSATPIPRTYALTIYGDMDISMIKEKPAGRKEITTTLKKFNEMNTIVEELESELINNHQAYVVAPLIEDEESDLNDLKDIEATLKEHLKGNYKIGVLHGKMKPLEKEKIMNDFKDGKTNILLSTTVIEVGVDVKNATMMIIFNAERFGLATLHQLRGRVGRNDLLSKCILISNKESERLNVLTESNDGFYISECDFKLRGSGDLFGIRQSGDMVFKIADLKTDYRILLQCKEDTEEFFSNNIENDFKDYPYYHTIVHKLIDND